VPPLSYRPAGTADRLGCPRPSATTRRTARRADRTSGVGTDGRSPQDARALHDVRLQALSAVAPVSASSGQPKKGHPGEGNGENIGPQCRSPAEKAPRSLPGKRVTFPPSAAPPARRSTRGSRKQRARLPRRGFPRRDAGDHREDVAVVVRCRRGGELILRPDQRGNRGSGRPPPFLRPKDGRVAVVAAVLSVVIAAQLVPPATVNPSTSGRNDEDRHEHRHNMPPRIPAKATARQPSGLSA
jgi:hypothetical protein